MTIDKTALLNSMRVLVVIFIILICIINFILLVKQIRKVRFYQSPKVMIIISLVIGDIMMAMFPLVVLAKLTIELDLSLLECRLNTAYETYYGFLLHFVYSLGLIALSIEVLIRSKLRSLCSPSVIAVVMGGIPWLLGLIIILPLCMAKMDYVSCINHEPLGSMYTVSVFMPASLAVILLIIFNCIRLPVDEQQHQPVIDSDLQPTTINSREVIALQQMPSNNIESNLNGARLNYPTATYHCVNNHAHVCSHFPYQRYSQNPPSYQDVALYPPNYQSVAQNPPNYQDVALYSLMQQGQVMHTTNHARVVHQTQSGNTIYFPDMRHKELQKLLKISIIFFLMVVPNAAIIIATGGNVYDTKSLTVEAQALNWLMVARSCLTPWIMMSYSDL